tara:strand:- start:8413 stop:8670 length:258 start_codon:yes stop_codon:yes gene_type:complete
MQALHGSFGGDKNKYYSIQDLVELMENVQPSSNFNKIIEDYVLKKNTILLTDYLKSVGLELKDDKTVKVNAIGEKEKKYLKELMN